MGQKERLDLWNKAKDYGLNETGQASYSMSEAELREVVERYESTKSDNPEESEEDVTEDVKDEVDEDQEEQEEELDDEELDEEEEVDVEFLNGKGDPIPIRKTKKKKPKKKPIQKSNRSYLQKYFPKKNTKASDLLKK